MQNFMPIAQKLAELWPFNFKMLVTDVRTLVTTESSSKSDDVDLANLKLVRLPFVILSVSICVIGIVLLEHKIFRHPP